jgi:hypothetical protein
MKTIGFKLSFTTIDDIYERLISKLFASVPSSVDISEQKLAM